MSTTMRAFCPLHEEDGPRIHRNAGGNVGLWPNQGDDIFDEDLARRQWNDWIINHEFCDFILKR